MVRRQKKPEITETRNGVQNFIKFMRDFYPNELAFPVQENYLKEYIAYKVKMGKLQTKYLVLYITNIKAHNEALGFSWTFGAIIKKALVVVSSKFQNSSGINLQDAPTEQANVTQNDNLPYNPSPCDACPFNPLPTYVNSSNLDISSRQGSDSFNASCNSQGGQFYDQNSTGLNFQDIPTYLNVQASVTQNDGRSPLSPGTSAPNVLPLSININSYTNQFDAQHVIPNNNFQTDNAYNVQTDVTQNDTFPYNMSYHDARPFPTPRINAPNNIGTQHIRIMPNNNLIYSQSFPDAHLSPQPEISNLQNILPNSDVQRKIAYLYYLLACLRR
ncbi:hypothetical protein C2G38_2038338 [Gigaspora rosea]|uniref:Uncharacterized protein n=1 Tax=Gigaspora rosea TaxID=44941 RepID=A0A397V5W4_9GLOM|nr:hypothetical protein C2G38_2038338 [Gigaspora rosea]